MWAREYERKYTAELEEVLFAASHWLVVGGTAFSCAATEVDVSVWLFAGGIAAEPDFAGKESDFDPEENVVVGVVVDAETVYWFVFPKHRNFGCGYLYSFPAVAASAVGDVLVVESAAYVYTAVPLPATAAAAPVPPTFVASPSQIASSVLFPAPSALAPIGFPASAVSLERSRNVASAVPVDYPDTAYASPSTPWAGRSLASDRALYAPVHSPAPSASRGYLMWEIPV